MHIANYRPITVSYILCRTYWGILDRRLREHTTFSSRQRGFVSEAGCFTNVHALDELLREAEKKIRIAVIQLDITKAFDTIPHQTIEPALQRLGIPTGMRSAISKSYHLKSHIQYKGTTTDLDLKRGVKQDPLNPTYFMSSWTPS